MSVPPWARRTMVGAAALIAVVLAGSLLVEYREIRLASLEAGGVSPPRFAEALAPAGLLGSLERAAIVLALSAMVPVCIALIGGPRRGTAVVALATWAISAAAMLAVLWSWTRLPA
jgi:hypothetical protein